jgi:hypothetical protein
MIIKPKIHGSNVLNPSVNTTHTVISRQGPGVFINAILKKMGGSDDRTSIQLKIDGQVVVAQSYAGADQSGLDMPNNFGVKLLEGSPDTFTIQFNEPVYFQNLFEITAFISTDAGINQISTQVLLAETCKYPI